MIKTGPVIFFLAFVFSIQLIGQEEFSSESELKAKANELFNESKFVEAAPLFSQLLSLYPKEVEYNFKYGASLIFADEDKFKPIKYLQFATSKSTVDPLAHYYLGLAYHLNYNFSKAIRQYSRFKSKASNAEVDELEVERKIEMCKNGSDLLPSISEVQVLDKKVVPEDNFFRSYKLDGIEGKIISKPDAFQSKEDKKQKDKSVIYLPEGAQEVIYSSYGKKGDRGLDLYKVVKLGNGAWSEPVELGPTINTPYDENYAFIHPDGKTLYFASKGHNSMGGYDLFKSTYDQALNEWGTPENLGFAFSSTSDDILFVTDKSGQIAYFASNRVNQQGKLTIYKVLTESEPIELSLIQGELIHEGSDDTPKATITVVNQKTNQPIGVFETNENGKYQVEIPTNGGTFKYNIETTTDAPIHTGVIEVPRQDEFKVLAQELRLVGSGDEQKLVIKNIFDGSRGDLSSQDGPLISSSTLLKKANLTVNASENQLAQSEETEDKATEQLGENATNLSSQIDQNSKQVDLAFNRAVDFRNQADEALENADQLEGAKAEEALSEAKELSLKALVSTQIAQKMNDQLNEQKALYNKLLTYEQDVQSGSGSSSELENEIQAVESEFESIASMNKLLTQESTELNKETSDLTQKINRQDKKINALNQESASVQQKIKDTESALNEAQSTDEAQKHEAELERLKAEAKDLNNQINRSLTEKERLRREKKVNETTLDQLAAISSDLENKSKLNSQQQLSEQQLNELVTSVKEYRDKDLLFANEMSEDDLLTNTEKSSQSNSSLNKSSNAKVQSIGSKAEAKDSTVEMEITEEELSTSDFSGLDFQPSNTDISESPEIKEAKEALLIAKHYNDLTEKLNQDVYSLETAEERNKAFEKINEYEKLSKEKQIEAASKYAEANRSAYFKNSEVLLKANNFSEEFNSSNLDMANLMAEEAEVYFSQAREIRYSISPDERFSKQIVELQKANDYEVMALDKQNKAIQLLNKVDEEYEVDRQTASASVGRYKPEIKMVQTISNPEVLAVEEAEVAQAKVDELVRESEQLKKEADSIQNIIANTSDNTEKEQLTKTLEQVEAEREKRQQLADVYYKRKIQIENGFADASSMEEVGAGINKPMATAVSIEVDTVNIDESRKQAILNSKDYDTYLREAQKNHRLKKRSQIDYENAKTLQIAQQDFSLKASAMRNQALETSDTDKRAQLVKRAEVLEEKALTAQKSIDSVSKIIKLRNYMIQQSDRSLNQVLAWVDDEDRGLLVHLAKQNLDQDLSEVESDVEDLAVIEKSQKDDFLPSSDRELVETVITQPQAKKVEKDVNQNVDLTENAEEEDVESGAKATKDSENISNQIGSTEDTERQLEDEVDLAESEVSENSEASNQADNTETIDAPTGSEEEGNNTSNLNQDQNSNQADEENTLDDNNETEPVVEPDEAERPNRMETIPRRISASVFNRLSPSQSAYSRSNPIPRVDKMPEGLVYKVQVGAFRNPIPQNMFKGFAPIMAQEGPNGITRYTAGFFLEEDEALTARDNIRQLGYKDAFVVAFLNGKRVGMTQARNMEDTSSEGSISSSATAITTEDHTKVDDIEDVFFTVQIGVFSKPLEKGTFSEFEPLNVAVLPNGMRRYNSGVYRTAQEAETAKNRINEVIEDAYVTAYYQGNRITLNEAARLQNR